jgi:hypothetical protein
MLTVRKQEKKKKNKYPPGCLQFEKLVIFHILSKLIFSLLRKLFSWNFCVLKLTKEEEREE